MKLEANGRLRLLLIAFMSVIIAGCAEPTVSSTVEMTPIAASAISDLREPYLLHAQDTIKFAVLGEPALSNDSLRIDANGDVNLPMIGSVRAAGLTSQQFARRVEALYSPRFLVRPSVTINLVSSVAERFSVEGSVTQPGVFELSGPTTLLTALARAQSPTRTADLRRIAIIRVEHGQRLGAVFDLQQIRAGRLVDPEIRAGDVVVVTSSWAKSAFRDLLTAAPGLAVFRPY